MTTKRIPKSGRKAVAKADDEFKVFRALQRAPVAMSQYEVLEIDNAFMTQPHGVARRVGLGIFTMSGKHLIDTIKRDRVKAVAFVVAANCIEGSVKATRELAEQLEVAAWRIRIALCIRDDMESVIAEAAHA